MSGDGIDAFFGIVPTKLYGKDNTEEKKFLQASERNLTEIMQIFDPDEMGDPLTELMVLFRVIFQLMKESNLSYDFEKMALLEAHILR